MACEGEQSELCLSGSCLILQDLACLFFQCLKEKTILGKEARKIGYYRLLGYMTHYPTSSVLDWSQNDNAQEPDRFHCECCQPLSHYHTTGTCMVTIIMCVVPEAFLRCNESTDLSRGISRVLYPTGPGYNRLIPFLGYSNLSTLCRHWYYGVDTHRLVAEAPLCLTEAAVQAQVLGWSNKQAFCFLQHMVAYSMHAQSPEIRPVITPEYCILIGWNSPSRV